MPIYEYKCENGHVFEVIQKFTDEPLGECQECGAPASRVLHSPAIHFKGSGFHNTDYGKKKAVPAGSTAESGNGSSERSDSSDSSGDSKPSDSSSSAAKPSTDSKSGDSKSPAKTAD